MLFGSIWQFEIFKLYAQHFFIEFADAGLGYSFDENNIIGHVHFWKTRFEMFEDLFTGDGIFEIWFRHDASQRAFLPFGVVDANDGVALH